MIGKGYYRVVTNKSIITITICKDIMSGEVLIVVTDSDAIYSLVSLLNEMKHCLSNGKRERIKYLN